MERVKKAHEYYTDMQRYFIRKSIKVDCICTAFEANYDSDFSFIGEFHPFWEFVYVLSGNVCASGDERIYHLSEGDIIFHKSMEFHRLWSAENSQSHLFIMSFFADGETTDKLENKVFSLTDEQKVKLFDLFHYLKSQTKEGAKTNPRVTHFLHNWDNYNSQNVANLLELFLLTFEKTTNLIEKKESAYGEIKVYKQILNILTENVHTWISLDDIAKQCHISKAQLKRVFANNSPTPIHKYFIRLKVAEAMTLILSGLSVSETSERLEFSNPNYFGKVFKRETGMSPLDYKKNNRLVN